MKLFLTKEIPVDLTGVDGYPWNYGLHRLADTAVLLEHLAVAETEERVTQLGVAGEDHDGGRTRDRAFGVRHAHPVRQAVLHLDHDRTLDVLGLARIGLEALLHELVVQGRPDQITRVGYRGRDVAQRRRRVDGVLDLLLSSAAAQNQRRQSDRRHADLSTDHLNLPRCSLWT